MDVSGLSTFLLSSGPWGAAVLYLLWDRHNLIGRLDKCQEAYKADLIRIVGEVTKAVTGSTETMRSAAQAQERMAASQSAIAEGLKLVQLALGTLEKDVARLDRETGP